MVRIVWPSQVTETAQEMAVPLVYTPPDAPRDETADVTRMSLADMYRQVPEVRTVVGFIARAVAGVPLHVFQRTTDTDRKRLTSGPLADLIASPSPGTDRFEWIESIVTDLAVYDRAFAVKVRGSDGTIEGLVRVPPTAVTANGDGLVSPDSFDVVTATGSRRFTPDDMLWVIGHDPAGGWRGTPILDALRTDLAEARELAHARRMAWQRGPKASAVVLRDTKWPNQEARARFLSGLGQFAGAGARVGGAMLLDDNMKYQQLQNNTFRDDQAVEGRGFVRQVVASAFGVSLTLLGDSDGATFATATAQRRTLYSEVLAAWFSRLAGALNRQVVAEFEGPATFVEFVVEAKLRGAFEEQAAVLSTSTGGPWMTRNEARARMNLPALDEGDELIVPLNVVTGGQASPRDVDGRPPAPGAGSPGKGRETGTTDRLAVKSAGSDVEGEYRGTVEDVLKRHFGRQSTAVLAALKNGDPEWWDGDRWNRELGKDLHDVAQDLVAQLGPVAAAGLGFDADEFDVPRTVEWLRAVTAKRAAWINDATRDQLVRVLDEVPVDGEQLMTPEDVFDEAKSSRAVAVAAGLTATVAGFAATEAARQLAPARSVKTWQVSSSNPRPSHAAMDGETVPVGETFSNGQQWPGDPAGGVDEVAGCTCGVVVGLSE